MCYDPCPDPFDKLPVPLCRGEQPMAVSATASATATMMYPERDGKPMGETDIHIDAMIYLREALKYYFRQTPQVYVAGNLLIYYEENNPAASIAPDVFVVPGVHKHQQALMITQRCDL